MSKTQSKHLDKIQVGRVCLDLSHYSGSDLYTDGVIEDELLELVKSVPATDFEQVISERAEWTHLYHLSDIRENIVKWIPFDQNAKILEVGSGCGAITGALAAAVSELTCVDLSKKRSLINAYRHRESTGAPIFIRVGNFIDIEPDLPCDYDMIFLIGVLEYAQSYVERDDPYGDFIKLLKKHLSPKGRLVIAIENQYGLKYFAGASEDHFGRYFSGIENYPREDGVRTFSRKGLKKLIKNAGFRDASFYYPYPDYKLPVSIYSDDYLPANGELTDNMRNFDRPRLLLFDESDAFDGIISQKEFPTFSNSFLVVTGKPFSVVYTKFSDNRDRAFRSVTQIFGKRDGRFVCKSAKNAEANAHIDNIYKACADLTARYEGSRIEVAPCKQNDDGSLEFPFIKGKTLEYRLDRLLDRNDLDGFYNLVRTYLEDIAYNPKNICVSDYDLIFSNIIAKDVDKTWTIIDYEWTLWEHITSEEICCRALFWYLNGAQKRRNILGGLEAVCERLGIGEDILKIREQREDAFQKMVTGNRLSMGHLRNAIGNEIINVPELAQAKKAADQKARAEAFRVYYDRGGGFCEEDSQIYEDALMGLGEVDFTFALPADTRRVRLDPTMQPCVTEVIEIKINHTPIRFGRKNTRLKRLFTPRAGAFVAKNTVHFYNNDPYFIFDVLENNIDSNSQSCLYVRMNVMPVEVINDFRAKNIAKIKATRIFKLTKPLRVLIHFCLRNAKRILRLGGPKQIYQKLRQKSLEYKAKAAFGTKSFPDLKTRKEQSDLAAEYAVSFSVLVPLYNTPQKFLTQMIDSVLNQTYHKWELCLADGSDAAHAYVGEIVKKFAESIAHKENYKDCRIVYKKLEKNGGISGNTNECLQLATGDYLCLFDHDDILHPAALYEYAKVIQSSGAKYIYCDEATFKGNSINHMVTLHFKPDYAPDNLRANNYICHFSVFSRELSDGGELFKAAYDGSQDHDMILRLTDKAAQLSAPICHIPKVLYYWRSHKNSVASDISAKTYAISAAQRAVEDSLYRNGFKDFSVKSSKAFETIFQVSYSLTNQPLVSILIPNCDHLEDISRCVRSILGRASYGNYEILILENNSSKKEVFDYYEQIKRDSRVRIMYYEGAFNFSAINNAGAKNAAGEYLLLLNNDTEVISHDFIEQLLMHAQRKDVGAVGAKLYYPDYTIQHAGVVIGLGAHRSAGHTHYKVAKTNLGYMGRLWYTQDVTAVTAACLMVKKSIYDALGGLDESFAVALNDVDFCLRLRETGLWNIFNPYCELFHYESASRGLDDDGEKLRRYNEESARFREKWKTALAAGDPFYNPNFSLDRSDFALKTQ